MEKTSDERKTKTCPNCGERVEFPFEHERVAPYDGGMTQIYWICKKREDATG